MNLAIYHGDNLDYLRAAAARGERFDLVELDGPYGAGLEEWDCLTDAGYVAHYAERLTLVRQVLQPWGVVEMFGYPEMVALVRAWAAETGILHLRRWLHWYKQITAHKGRKVEVVAVFTQPSGADLFAEFKVWLRRRRREMRITIAASRKALGMRLYGKNDTDGSGYLWFEANDSSVPTREEYRRMKVYFSIPDRFDMLCDLQSFDGLTNLDFITVPAERAARLNDDGLRSKPVGLYLDIFRPVVPPRDTKRALILYGGSGNAAVAAARLGYDVTVCEADAARCDLIRCNYAQRIEHSLKGMPLFEGVA